MGDVEDSAKQAMIYENIVRFPDRFDTLLGERGLTLSGGQRQRTSLARGLIKQAQILILDDSMSAVDAVTETGILRSLRKIGKGKTTLIISPYQRSPSCGCHPLCWMKADRRTRNPCGADGCQRPVRGDLSLARGGVTSCLMRTKILNTVTII